MQSVSARSIGIGGRRPRRAAGYWIMAIIEIEIAIEIAIDRNIRKFDPDTDTDPDPDSHTHTRAFPWAFVLICGAAGTPLPYRLRAFPWAFVLICGAAGTPLPLQACVQLPGDYRMSDPDSF